MEAKTADQYANEFRSGFPDGLHDNWWTDPVIVSAHQMLLREVVNAGATLPPVVHNGERGIVICGGGKRLFTNAYVCIRMLRHVGCKLPIELWYLGDDELDIVMRHLVEPYGVRCVNASAVADAMKTPPRILHGWEVKAFAMENSAFRHVLMLDADNIAVRDPAYLFDDAQRQSLGAIFWPDYGRLAADRMIWGICGVEYRDEPEFESGQAIVDRVRYQRALRVAMHMNEHSDFYYKHVHGDKDTFHMAWHIVGCDYAMPPRGIESLESLVMCQHDMNGDRIFQHRNMDKWDYSGNNRPISGFQHEAQCRQFLAELRHQWDGEVWSSKGQVLVGDENQDVVSELSKQVWTYERVGYDAREITFRTDGTIGAGAGGCERYWRVVPDADGSPLLIISGGARITAKLRRNGGEWNGAWLIHERMPIRVTPANAASGSTLLVVGHCGTGEKAHFGTISAGEGQSMLAAAVARANTLRLPVLISCIGPLRYTDHLREVDQKSSEVRIISTVSNPGHSGGARLAISNALRYAKEHGFRYMVHIGDDCLMNSRDAIKDMISSLDSGIDYMTNHLNDDGSTLGTQVFACRVDSMYVEHECLFDNLNCGGAILEQEVALKMREAGLKVSTAAPGYFHSHDPQDFLSHYKSMEGKA